MEGPTKKNNQTNKINAYQKKKKKARQHKWKIIKCKINVVHDK